MKTVLLPICLALALLGASAQAQGRVYRCGNEYTNKIKGRTDCRPVEGGNITIVRGYTAPPRSYSGGTRSSGTRSASTTRTTTSPSGTVTRVHSPEQVKRDSDARAILEQELSRAEARQAELLREYNNGQPERLGSERDYNKYLARTSELKSSIDRNQADIEGIKRELTRFK
ncbi:MAG: hypothetical protein J6T92_04255 [Ottowia sp.]|nr:hypothetical protein [Ottowia sp.]